MRLYFNPNLSKSTVAFVILYGIVYLYSDCPNNRLTRVTRIIVAKFIAYGVQRDAFAALSMLFLMRARIQQKLKLSSGHFTIISRTLIKQIGPYSTHGLAGYVPNAQRVWWTLANLCIGPYGLPALLGVHIHQHSGDEAKDYNAHTSKNRTNAPVTLQRILIRKLGWIVGYD